MIVGIFEGTYSTVHRLAHRPGVENMRDRRSASAASWRSTASASRAAGGPRRRSRRPTRRPGSRGSRSHSAPTGCLRRPSPRPRAEPGVEASEPWPRESGPTRRPPRLPWPRQPPGRRADRPGPASAHGRAPASTRSTGGDTNSPDADPLPFRHPWRGSGTRRRALCRSPRPTSWRCSVTSRTSGGAAEAEAVLAPIAGRGTPHARGARQHGRREGPRVAWSEQGLEHPRPGT